MDEKILFVDDINEVWQMIMQRMIDEGKTDEEIQEFFQSDKYKEASMELMKEMAESHFTTLSTDLLDLDSNIVQAKTEYRDHLESVWGEGFAWLRQYYKVCTDVCVGYCKRVNQNQVVSDKCNVANALRSLHGKGMMVYAEIVCLLENGFPDGAYAHFRMLYELWAVAEFLAHDTDEVAIAYIESANSTSNQESSHYEWANNSDRFMDTEKKATISGIVNEAHKTFKEGVSQKVSNRYLSDVYTFPNQLIHPSAQGVFYRTSGPYPESITIGPADTGMAIPAMNATMVIHNMNDLFMNFIPNEVSFIGLRILNDIVEKKVIPIFKGIDEKLKKEMEN